MSRSEGTESLFDARPRRPLRVLGLHGWLRWQPVARGPKWTTYTLNFDGETPELEDFDLV